MEIDFRAPIIPANSIASIPLGLHVKDLEKFVDLGHGNADFVGETKYEIEGGIISIAVHNKSNRIFRISALQGYEGSLFGKYKSGMPIEKLIEDPQWWFNEEQGGFSSQVHGGVICCPDLEDPRSGEFMGRFIGEISVFVLNIDRLEEEWSP